MPFFYRPKPVVNAPRAIDIPVKILIVGPSWVGDMVMAQTLFITLKALHPDCRIEVLAPAWSRPLLERMPEVSASHAMPLGHGKLDLATRRALGRELAALQFDQAIVLPNSLKSALVPWFAGIPLRTGWRGEMRYGLLNDLRKLDKDADPLMIERFIALAYAKGEKLPAQRPRPHLVVDAANVATAQQRFGLNGARKVLGIAPGAEFGEAKRWPERHYAALARHYLQQGWQLWLFGSAKDRPVTDAICSELTEFDEQLHNLAGETELADAVDLLSVCDAVVANDSGLMHIAAALDRPLAVVYGSTSPGFTPPLNDRCAIVQLAIECNPCFQRECPKQHLRCLNELEPERVIAALEPLLEQPVEVRS